MVNQEHIPKLKAYYKRNCNIVALKSREFIDSLPPSSS